MKKRIAMMLMSGVLVISALTGCNMGPETAGAGAAQSGSSRAGDAGADDKAGDTDGSVKIGVTVQSLSNQVWAGACSTMQERAKADGNELTYMSCDDNSSKQIEQIENYISSGCDVIMVNPSDPNAIESVRASARAEGIKVMCWDNEMENTDLNWIIDNETLGYMIGEQASGFIKEKFEGGACEVAVLNYPQTEILLEREKGILKAIEELAPQAKVVAQQPAIDANEGLAAMETILQANPDVKVVCCIGGGGAVGANEAFKANGEITEDVGIFAADATNEELSAMVNGEANRMSVIITGTPVTIGGTVYNMLAKLGSGQGFTEADLAEGETMDGKNVYRNILPVTIDNVNEYYSK